MTVLFTGSVSFPSGVTDSGVFAVPNGIKSVRFSMPADPVPVNTEILMFLSFDGGATFPAGGGGTRPTSFFIRDTAHIWQMAYENARQPTHTKARVTAPSAFTSTLTLETP